MNTDKHNFIKQRHNCSKPGYNLRLPLSVEMSSKFQAVDFNQKTTSMDIINKACFTVILCLATLLSFTTVRAQQSTVWKAPQEADDLSNPIKGNASALTSGKELFASMCAICHGNKGKGDGIAGINLKPRPTNLSSATVQEQSDGALYWKITEGRAPMATYKTVLTEEQRWQLVNYIRDLKK